MRINRTLLIGTLILGLSASAWAQAPAIVRQPSRAGLIGKMPHPGSIAPSPLPPSDGTTTQAILGDGTPVEIRRVSWPPPLHVLTMKQLAPGIGWAIATGSRLYWTSNNGANWKDITPRLSDAGKFQAIRAAFFLDTRRGWALIHTGFEDVPGEEGGRTATFDVASTVDAGGTWERHRLVMPPAMKPGTEGEYNYVADPIGEGSLSFSDAHHGWMSLVGFGNLGQGMLLVTSDGGRMWKQAPGDLLRCGQIVLVTPEEGWLVAAPGDDELYVTRDGAKTFKEVSVQTPTELPPKRGSHDYSRLFAPPVFLNDKRGFLQVTFIGDPKKPNSATVLFATKDGGQTWKTERMLKDLADTQGLGAMPSTIVDSTWITVQEKNYRLTLSEPHSGDRVSARTESGSSGSGYWGISDPSFLSANVGWVIAGDYQLMSTSDGGMSWTNITPGPKPHVIQPQGSSLPDDPTSDLAASPLPDNPAVAGPAAPRARSALPSQ